MTNQHPKHGIRYKPFGELREGDEGHDLGEEGEDEFAEQYGGDE